MYKINILNWEAKYKFLWDDMKLWITNVSIW